MSFNKQDILQLSTKKSAFLLLNYLIALMMNLLINLFQSGKKDLYRKEWKMIIKNSSDVILWSEFRKKYYVYR